LKTSTVVLILLGILLFVTGFFVVNSQQGLKQGYYTVKAGGSVELSWYLEEGDRTEGFFNVSGGNGRANLIVKDPLGMIVVNWNAQGRFDNGFDAQITGTYTMILTNLDTLHDQTIYVGFVSPYDTIHISYIVGLFMFGVGIILTLLGIATLFERNHARARTLMRQSQKTVISCWDVQGKMSEARPFMPSRSLHVLFPSLRTKCVNYYN
jgi:hypothetical protein